jgi:hypothetical protein
MTIRCPTAKYNRASSSRTPRFTSSMNPAMACCSTPRGRCWWASRVERWATSSWGCWRPTIRVALSAELEQLRADLAADPYFKDVPSFPARSGARRRWRFTPRTICPKCAGRCSSCCCATRSSFTRWCATCMRITLKSYQQSALDALAALTLGRARAARTKGPALAFGELAGRPYNPDAFGASALRVPAHPHGRGQDGAGGARGAAAGARVARHDAPVAVWLVPSDTIRSQTLKALQTPGHPYRAALEDAYGEGLRCARSTTWRRSPRRTGGARPWWWWPPSRAFASRTRAAQCVQLFGGV